jgi:hypothetical protein
MIVFFERECRCGRSIRVTGDTTTGHEQTFVCECDEVWWLSWSDPYRNDAGQVGVMAHLRAAERQDNEAERHQWFPLKDETTEGIQ